MANFELHSSAHVLQWCAQKVKAWPACACVRVNSFKVACAELQAQSLADFYSHVFVRFGVASLAWLQAMFGHCPWPSIFVLKLLSSSKS